MALITRLKLHRRAGLAHVIIIIIMNTSAVYDVTMGASELKAPIYVFGAQVGARTHPSCASSNDDVTITRQRCRARQWACRAGRDDAAWSLACLDSRTGRRRSAPGGDEVD